ncbi:TetR/AcrR family transcriptional regulator [Rhodococcus sp. KRD175]|uniref:TetR/AcrR family transcriptional regulator n=1 Tax=Rhodococcus sp. KRD175 TaxID=2729729 RepID=UPI0019CF6F2A|nr:TetR/AcrR family transcriptional regulator [Rhodococcus sp. KRD175]
MSTRVPTEQLQMQVCEAAAAVMLDGGMDALTTDGVVDAAGVSRGRMVRAYTSRAQLISGVYAHGHARIMALCERQRRRGRSGVDALVALTYDLLEHTAVDPLVRAVHALESTEYAAETGVGSVYRLWRGEFTEMLVGGGERGRDPLVADTDHRQIVEVVDVLVAAVAGLCDPRRWSTTTTRERIDRLHIVLYAVIPALCTDTADADFVRLYLERVRDHVAADIDTTSVEPADVDTVVTAHR